MTARARVTVTGAAMMMVFGGCGGDDRHDYPASGKRAILAKCEKTSGGNTSFCECALDEFQEILSYDELKRLDRAILAGRATPSREVEDALAKCQ